MQRKELLYIITNIINMTFKYVRAETASGTDISDRYWEQSMLGFWQRSKSLLADIILKMMFGVSL